MGRRTFCSIVNKFKVVFRHISEFCGLSERLLMYHCLNLLWGNQKLSSFLGQFDNLDSGVIFSVKLPRSIDNTHIYTFSSSDNWTLWTPESTRKGVFFQCFSIKAKEVKLSMYAIVRINQGGSCLIFPDTHVSTLFLLQTIGQSDVSWYTRTRSSWITFSLGTENT